MIAALVTPAIGNLYMMMSEDELVPLPLEWRLATKLVQETGAKVALVPFKVGRHLKPGEESSTGFYAICDWTTRKVLKVTNAVDLAEMFCDPDTNEINEVKLFPHKKKVLDV